MTNSRFFSRLAPALSMALLLCALSGFVTTASAQVVGVDAGDINLSLSPEIPGPNQQVTATLESFTINLNNHEINWFVNGQLISREIGLKTLVFSTGNAGTATVLEARIMYNGQIISKTTNINPTSVDILWEADTYAPPFYRGKKLPTRQSTIKFTAIPQFKNPTIDSIRTAVYYWEREYAPQSSASGYGKQAFSFENSPIKPSEAVTVTVRDPREAEAAESTQNIAFGEPRVVFYEQQDFRTLWRRGSMAGFRVNTERFGMTAVPYFASFDSVADISFVWLANNVPLQSNSAGQPNEIILDLPERGRTTTLTTNYQHFSKLLQKKSQNLQLIY